MLKVYITMLLLMGPIFSVAYAHPVDTITTIHVTEDGYKFAMDVAKIREISRKITHGKVPPHEISAQIQRKLLQKLEDHFPNPKDLGSEKFKISGACKSFSFPPLQYDCWIDITF